MKKIIFFALCGLFSFSNAQVASINENFDYFNDIFPFPQNDWTISTVHNQAIRIGGNFIANGNRYVQANGITAICCSSVNVPQYLFSPQIVAPDGTKTLSFDVYLSTQFSTTATTVEVGLITNPSDLSTFTSLGTPFTVQTTTPITLSYVVPNSSQQYFVFKFISPSANSQTILDNVIYGLNLSVTDSSFDNKVNFVIKDNHLLFLNKDKIIDLKIYNTSGQLVLQGFDSASYDISALQTGMYIFQALTDRKTKYISKFRK